ncbi:exocyst complex component 4 isoform X4 [Eurytemora carolleeae]|uniref:exocyst complex component 4 isoform X4 n=1 Tax=Eurytemora carolleeae TaxID=1294199 RepID=UPI000C763465|nr:exocyst complex component 4 isoform X4 [Eurytemora carolleeae]|eukprot:XP_023334937.1 exocyst complex component 4-like isoform X4 [Eurytemora affinis]
MAKKEFLKATEGLAKSLDLLNGPLKEVEALVEVKVELETRSTLLYTRLLEDLSSQLYIESTWDVLQLQRAGSAREAPFQRAGSGRNSSDRTPGSGRGKEGGSGRGKEGREGSGRKPGEHLKARRLLLDPGSNSGSLLSPAEEDSWNLILENPEKADPSKGPAHCILIDMECLALLNRLPEAIESLTSELQGQLFQILTRSTHQLLDTAKYSQGDKRLLPQLFSAVVSQLNRVVDAYRLAAKAGQRAVTRHKADPVRLDLADVWSKVQSVIQVLLTDYLDFKSSSTMGSINVHQNTSNNFSEPTADINSYFVRRKIARPKRSSLFRFDSSSTALTINDFMRENNAEESGFGGGGDEKVLVCDANPHNITLIFNQLIAFIQQIEKALKCQPGTHCTLYAFLMDYIKDVFLGQIHVDISNSLNSASQSLDAWKSVTDSEILRNLKVSRPLLQSTVNVWKSIEDLGEMMVTLPLYSTHFLTIMCNILMQYKEICGAAYRGLVQPDTEDKRIISAQWAKDEDISRFLKSLPNWEAVFEDDDVGGGGGGRGVEESVEEVEKRNRKETEILVQNLGSSDIPQHEILSDSNQLRSLAQLHESLDWFARSVLNLSKTLKDHALPESTLQTLISLAQEFVELGDICLLVLHLEVRVHCFFYLLPLWRGPGGGPSQYFGGPDSTDPSNEIIQLNRDLVAVEDALDSALQPRRIQYIFEGVSHLVSGILISSAATIKKMNGNGVKKMCRNIFSVQQTLTTSVTGRREVALDQAKTFYELVNFTPGEMLTHIVERGAMFSQLDYINLLQLINRSQPRPDNEGLSKNIEKLSEILNGAGARPGVAV